MLDLKTIDISDASQSTAEGVTQAAQTLGFIYVSGHSIPRSLMQRIFELSASLFKLDITEKGKFSIGTENRGWSRMGSEKLDPATQKNGDYKEAFNLAPSSEQPLPELLERDRKLLKEFEGACHTLLLKLCRLLARGLGLQEERSASKHNSERFSGTMMRLLYYPNAQSTTMSHGEVRAGAHTDYGSLTLLFQKPGQSGLEIQHPDTQAFEAVPAPVSDCENDELPILVNVADQLTLWTAGRLKSAVHRVTSTYTGDRYSIAYFCHPDDDTLLEPIPELTTSKSGTFEGTASGLTAGEHLRRRLAATYSY